MNNSDLCWMSASDLTAAIARKRVSPVEVVDAVLERIGTLKELNAWSGARRRARRFDEVTVLRASAAFEAAHPWAQRRPALGSR